MHQFRPFVKLAFGLLTLWLALVWAKLLPRPDFIPLETEIEPLTLVVGTIAVLLLGFWKPAPPNPASALTNALEPSLEAELIANLKAKYQKRIDSKLAGRFPVNLRINASNTGTSEETAQNFITLQDEEVGPEIGEIFDRAKGRLLVIGLPGAGKTTLLLQLAVELLKRAESVPATSVAAKPPAANPVIPAAKAAGTIPVLLNLATWRSEFGTFEEWLKRILPNELGASKALAEKIRANIPLVLLLDGLDEVPEADRNSCLEALGQYGMNDKIKFVVSSRITEYAAAIDARNINAQVEVSPLDAEQIELNLAAQSKEVRVGATALYKAIKEKDPLLKQAIENPFYLNTAQLLFASGKNWSEFGFVATDVVGRQKELVERFVGYALEHKLKRKYKPEQVKKWLGFLAGKMEAGGLRVFELVDISQWGGWHVDSKQPFAVVIIIYFLSMLMLGIPIAILFYMILVGEVNAGFVSILQMLTTFIALFLATTSSLSTIKSRLLYLETPYSRFKNLPMFLLTFPHIYYRLKLFRKKLLPLRLVHFLNEMSRRHILEFDGNLDTETGGGSWRWRHRIIQEYFLKKYDV